MLVKREVEHLTESSRKQMIFKSGNEVERERESRSLTQQVAVSFKSRGAAVLNDRLANDVRRNGTHSSGTDDDRMLHALVRNEMCCGDDIG